MSGSSSVAPAARILLCLPLLLVLGLLAAPCARGSDLRPGQSITTYTTAFGWNLGVEAFDELDQLDDELAIWAPIELSSEDARIVLAVHAGLDTCVLVGDVEGGDLGRLVVETALPLIRARRGISTTHELEIDVRVLDVFRLRELGHLGRDSATRLAEDRTSRRAGHRPSVVLELAVKAHEVLLALECDESVGSCRNGHQNTKQVGVSEDILARPGEICLDLDGLLELTFD